MPFVSGFLRIRRPGRHPDQGLPPGEGPVDPGYGVGCPRPRPARTRVCQERPPARTRDCQGARRGPTRACQNPRFTGSWPVFRGSVGAMCASIRA